MSKSFIRIMKLKFYDELAYQELCSIENIDIMEEKNVPEKS